MAFDFGGALNNVLDKGLDIWADTEKAHNFQPGAQGVGQRAANGTTAPAGQPAASVVVANDWTKNPIVWLGVGLAVLLVVVVVVKD